MAVLLFPHSYIPETVNDNVFNFFGPITIFQPWFMGIPDFLKDKSVDILNPPNELKPKEGFKNILTEYRQWVEQNRDRSYLEIIRSNQDTELTENHTWEIRSMVSRMVQSVSDREEEKTFRWHILLHLAREIDEQHMEADKMLRSLKDKEPIFEGSIERTDNVNDLLRDLPQFETKSFFNESNLKQIFEAWFGLFGGYLKDSDLLITYNRLVIDYISERWDDLSNDGDPTIRSTIKLKIPYLSHYAPARQHEIRREYHIDERFGKMKDLIYELEESPSSKSAELEKLFKEFEDSFPWELSDSSLSVSLKYLDPVSDIEFPQTEEILKPLFHKTIILVE